MKFQFDHDYAPVFLTWSDLNSHRLNAFRECIQMNMMAHRLCQIKRRYVPLFFSIYTQKRNLEGVHTRIDPLAGVGIMFVTSKRIDVRMCTRPTGHLIFLFSFFHVRRSLIIITSIVISLSNNFPKVTLPWKLTILLIFDYPYEEREQTKK